METVIPPYRENDSAFEIGFFKKIAEGAPVGIILADSENHLIVYANPAAGFPQTSGTEETPGPVADR